MHSEENNKTFTYQSRPVIDEPTANTLESCAGLFSHVERALFADISAGKTAADLKVEYLKKYQITARHFNAIRVQLEGKISAIKERQTQLITEVGYKIQSVTKTIQKLEKKSSTNKLHQKKRLLFNLQQKEKKLKTDQETGKVHLCFGSKSLFRAQFDLTANGYKSHKEWHADWQQLRDNSFFLLGSKDESSGNQSCTATLCSDGSLSIRIRLPDALNKQKYLIIPNIRFQYGHREIVKALNSCHTRKQSQKLKDPNYKNQGSAISYRFKRDKKGWRLFVTVSVKQEKVVTSTQQGVIGVDINANHLAITETDRFGNPITKKTLKLNTYGKNHNQTKALIGDLCSTLVEQAKTTGKSLVIEKLDFQKKKTQLKAQHVSHARMLSGLAYQHIKNNLKSRAWRNGVLITEVNPAFTSLIGKVKFSRRYGLSNHHAAALVIGRRHLKCTERVPRHLEIPDGKSAHVTLSLPARNRDKHVWSEWRIIDRKLKTVLAAHFRAKKNRSLSSKPALEIHTIPKFAGAIPARESVNTTARLACLDLSI